MEAEVKARREKKFQTQTLLHPGGPFSPLGWNGFGFCSQMDLNQSLRRDLCKKADSSSDEKPVSRHLGTGPSPTGLCYL